MFDTVKDARLSKICRFLKAELLFNSLRKKAKSQEQGILPLLRENVASAVLVLRRPQTLGKLVRAVASGMRRSQVRERGEREEKAQGAEGGQVQGMQTSLAGM